MTSRVDRRKDEGAERDVLSLRNVGGGVAFTVRSAAGEQWRWKEEGRPEGRRERERERESYLTYFLSYVAHRAKRLSKGQKLSNQSALIGANTACQRVQRDGQRGKRRREGGERGRLMNLPFVVSTTETRSPRFSSYAREMRDLSLTSRDFRDNRLSD